MPSDPIWRTYDVVVLHGNYEYRPPASINVYAWLVAGHLDPIYRINVRLKPHA